MTSAVDVTRFLKGHSREWLFCFSCLLVAALNLSACAKPAPLLQLEGRSMGTSWHVTLMPATGQTADREALQHGIEAALEAVNHSMSTYRDDSEISRFNALSPDTWFDLSPDFYTVLSTALAVGWQSGGAYDVTVAPLVNLWGFGPVGPVHGAPAQELIEQQLQDIGPDTLRLDGEGPRLLKRSPVTLDFSSIAKGFAVDQVAQWLDTQGLSRYLVEVGGEMRLSGLSPRDDLWRIAIEQPDSATMEVGAAVRLTDAAIATSGDYRNFFEFEGKRYSHSIDPRTGYPVSHDLVSVTVIHNSAMIADAWATALTVLGSQEGMAVALSHGLAVYFIQRRDGEFNHSHTPAFGQYLEVALPDKQ